MNTKKSTVDTGKGKTDKLSKDTKRADAEYGAELSAGFLTTPYTSTVVKTSGSQFVKGAFILGVCGFVGKLFGAIYRIPLTNILGAEGMGLYQMIFPMYALLISLTSSGIPTALSHLIAENTARGRNSRAGNLWFTALISLVVLGVLSGVVLFFLARPIAALQGNPDAAFAYMAVAPSLLFIAVVASLRGYFQGRQNMIPTSVSQIFEQIVRMAAGLFLAYRLIPYGLAYGVMGAAIGVTISEFAAMIVMLLMAGTKKNRLPLHKPFDGFFDSVKTVYSLSVPITIGSLIMPLTQLIDSSIVINLLVAGGNSISDATALFGLATGPVGSLINMPVVLSLAIATAIVPTISASNARGDSKAVGKKAGLAMQLTLLIAVPCVVIFALFPTQIIDILYSGLKSTGTLDEAHTAAQLLSLSAVTVLLIAFIQVSTSILHSLGKSFMPVLNLLIGAAVKLIVNVVLLPRIGIYASVISNICCFGTACVLDLIALLRATKLDIKFYKIWIAPVLSGLIAAALGYGVYKISNNFVSITPSFVVAIITVALAYFLLLPVLNAYDAKEMAALPVIGKFFKARKPSK